MKKAVARSVRYECLVDPSDLYVIWDNLADAPCMADGNILAFATEAKAAEALKRLSRSDMPNACRWPDLAGDISASRRRLP